MSELKELKMKIEARIKEISECPTRDLWFKLKVGEANDWTNALDWVLSELRKIQRTGRGEVK